MSGQNCLVVSTSQDYDSASPLTDIKAAYAEKVFPTFSNSLKAVVHKKHILGA